MAHASQPRILAGQRALVIGANSSIGEAVAPAAYDDLMRLIPYKRIGEPADIPQVAVFLASDLADYVTGQTIFVDGGTTCYPEFSTGG